MYSRGKANVVASDKQKGEKNRETAPEELTIEFWKLELEAKVHNPKGRKMDSVTFQLKL